MDFKLGLHESLFQVSEPWDFKTDRDAKLLESQMIDFMLKNNGIGLAANQIGIAKRVFVMGSKNIPGFPAPMALFNPVILNASDETTLDKEGCLSYPDLYLMVKRPSKIIVQYQNSDGDIIESEIDGYLAKCFQHELDHLNGVCFVDRVSQMKLNLAMNKIKKRKSYA